MKKLFVGFSCFALICTAAMAETVEVQPQGVYAKIDTKKEIQAIDLLLNGTKAEQDKTAETVLAHSDEYCPVVFFYLANYYFQNKKDDDAVFWLYAARIRMWYDVKKCTDQSVQDSVDEMGNQMPDLLRVLQFEDIAKSKELLKKAIEWDRKTPHNYDSAWIALHGMGAFLPDAGQKTLESLNIPKDQWEALAEENRKDYLQSYIEYFDQITPEDLALMKDKIQELKKSEPTDTSLNLE